MPRFRVVFETEDNPALPSALALLQGMGFDPRLFELVPVKPERPVRQPTTGHIQRQPVTGTNGFDRDAAWRTFLALSKENPKKVLQLIKDGGQSGLSAEAIAEQFDKKANWFTGVLNGGFSETSRRLVFS